METADIGSLLDARAAALLRGVAKLPPIEQDLRRLRNSHIAPQHFVTTTSQHPHCGGGLTYMDRHQQCGRGILPNRPPAFNVFPFPNRQQVHQAFNNVAHQWQPLQAIRPASSAASQQPRKVCHELHLPSPTVDSKTPLGVLISPAARIRARRSSDYSAVSARTRELTLFSLVESLLKQQQHHRKSTFGSAGSNYHQRREQDEDDSTPKQQSSSPRQASTSPICVETAKAESLPQAGGMEYCRRATSSMATSASQSKRSGIKPVLLVPPSSASTTSTTTTTGLFSPRDTGSRVTIGNLEQSVSSSFLSSSPSSPTKQNWTSLCASRCSTADVGLSRASFWEEDDDDDDDYIDEQFTFVPKPPSHKKESTTTTTPRVYNLCEEEEPSL